VSALDALPAWAALLVALLALASATFTLVGSLGLLRLRTFFQRLHAPTLGTTFGMALMVAAAFIGFSLLDCAPAFEVLLIGVFLTLATPVTLLLLSRAASARGDGATPEAPTRSAPTREA
jgi:multicomponent K+:H+ antiporter subunit G